MASMRLPRRLSFDHVRAMSPRRGPIELEDRSAAFAALMAAAAMADSSVRACHARKCSAGSSRRPSTL
eukprot:8273631-Pyramimonas_sp.AAC.1